MKRENLIAFRKKQKLTQKEMAEKLNISDMTYKSIELGYRNPSFNLLKSFKNTFQKINIDKIFFN